MNKYIYFIGLIIISIGQIAWAPFLMTQGVIIPIVVIYLWLIKSRLDLDLVIIWAVIGGLVIDILSISYLGAHSLILLIVMSVVHLIEKRIFYSYVISRWISLAAGVIVYLTLINRVGVWFS